MRQTSTQLSQPSQKVFHNPVTVLLDKFVDLIALHKKAPRHAVMLCVPQKVRAKVMFARRPVDRPALPDNFVVDRGIVVGKYTDSKNQTLAESDVRTQSGAPLLGRTQSDTSEGIVALTAEDIHTCKEAGFRFNMPETLGHRTDLVHCQALQPRSDAFESDNDE
jgi:hypothetical protein